MSEPEIKFQHDQFSGYINNTDVSNQDLGTLITKLVNAAEPLKEKFEGSGRGSFDQLHVRAKEISDMLKKDLNSLQEGQVEISNAVVQGDEAMSDAAQRQMNASNFDNVKFRA